MVIFGIGVFESAGMVVRVCCAFKNVTNTSRTESGNLSFTMEEKGREEKRRKTRVRRLIMLMWGIAWRALLVQWILVGGIVVGFFWEVRSAMGGLEALGCLGLLVVWARTEWVALMGVGKLARKFEVVDEDRNVSLGKSDGGRAK